MCYLEALNSIQIQLSLIERKKKHVTFETTCNCLNMYSMDATMYILEIQEGNKPSVW